MKVRIYLAIAKFCERRAGVHAHGSRTCSACHKRIGKNDKFRQLDVRHLDCNHPATHPLPETLMAEMEKGRI